MRRLQYLPPPSAHVASSPSNVESSIAVADMDNVGSSLLVTDSRFRLPSVADPASMVIGTDVCSWQGLPPDQAAIGEHMYLCPAFLLSKRADPNPSEGACSSSSHHTSGTCFFSELEEPSPYSSLTMNEGGPDGRKQPMATQDAEHSSGMSCSTEILCLSEIFRMEPSSYDKLPNEIKEEILARVSCVTQLFKLRLVCRDWNSVICSQNFVKLQCQRTPSSEPWLVVVKRGRSPNQKLYLCDYLMQRWILPPLPFLNELQCDFSICKSHGGLVCCIASRDKRGPKTVLVFNPFTSDYRLLPYPTYPSYWSISTLELALWWNKNSNYFKVAICETSMRDVRVFDSRKGYWKEGERPPDVGEFKPCFGGFRNASKDKLYWYDVERDAWQETTLPSVDQITLEFPSVCKEDDGNIMLAAVLSMAECGRPAYIKGFAVWDLLNNKQHPQPQNHRNHSQGRHRCDAKMKHVEEQDPTHSTSFIRFTQQSSSSMSSTGCHGLYQPRHHYDHLPLANILSQNPNRPLHMPPMDCANEPNCGHEPSTQKDGTLTWFEKSRTPSNFLRGPRGMLQRLNDSNLICHPKYVCMTGLLRYSMSPWNCFYPWLLVFSPQHNTWKWSSHHFGDKTWAYYNPVCVLDANLQCIP